MRCSDRGQHIAKTRSDINSENNRRLDADKSIRHGRRWDRAQFPFPRSRDEGAA